MILQQAEQSPRCRPALPALFVLFLGLSIHPFDASIVRGFTTSVGSERLHRATAQGTAQLAARHQADRPDPSGVPYYMNPKTGWTLSRIGAGATRMSESQAEHAAALRAAIEGGINLVDTAHTFTGSSQRLVGRILQDLIREGSVTREELVLVTKAGIVPKNEMTADLKSLGGNDGVIQIDGDRRALCFSPTFLKKQLTQSIQQLQTNTVDLLLLQEPEWLWRSLPAEQAMSAWQHAVQWLERAVQAGTIQGYGVSSPALSSDPMLSKTLLEAVQRVAGPTHHFHCVEYPINLLEPHLGVDHLPKDMITLSTRPLQAAIHRQTLFDEHYRLLHAEGINIPRENVEPIMFTLNDAAPERADKDIPRLVKEVIDFSMMLEKDYPSLYARSTQQKLLPAPAEVCWMAVILQHIPRIDLAVFELFAQKHVIPALASMAPKIGDHGTAELQQWFAKYNLGVRATLERYQWLLEANRFQDIQDLKRALDAACPSLTSNKWLATKVIRSTLSSSVQPTVVVSMRTPHNVRLLLSDGPMSPLQFCADDEKKLFRDVPNAFVQQIQLGIQKQLERRRAVLLKRSNQ